MATELLYERIVQHFLHQPSHSFSKKRIKIYTHKFRIILGTSEKKLFQILNKDD